MSSGPYFYTDPISLTLAADHSQALNLEPPDIVWQLNLDPNQPIALQTTLGLQAQSFSVIPTISRGNHLFRLLREYLTSPRIDSLCPSYVSISLAADESTQATYEFWAREPHTLSGRVTLRNTAQTTAELSTRLTGLLVPLDGGQSMTLVNTDYITSLRGQSGELTAALIIDGAPKPILSPQKALEVGQTLLPGEDFSVSWRCVLAFSADQCQQRLSVPFLPNWRAETARLEVAEQARTLEIETPLNDWNLVFKSMQSQANQLLNLSGSHDSAETDQFISVFEKRNIDNPAEKAPSARGLRASGGALSVLALRQLVRTLLPAQVETAVSLVRNLLASLSSQSKNTPPFPCLAALIWDVHTYYQNPLYLAECLPLLLEQTLSWFTPEHDRDQDGLPEWFNLVQTGLNDLLLFDLHAEDALPTNISTTESFALTALLLNELDLLQRMSRVLGDAQTYSRIQPFKDRLENAFRRWQTELPTASFIDRDTHQAQHAQIVTEVLLPSETWQSIPLDPPARLNISLKSDIWINLSAGLRVLGTDGQGGSISEKIEPNEIFRLPTQSHATTQAVYSRFDGIHGLGAVTGSATVYACELQQSDISQLVGWERPTTETDLPEWAAANNFRCRFGLPTQLSSETGAEAKVNVAWNCLVIEHFIRIGEKKLAFDLLSRLLLGFAEVLKREHVVMESFMSGTALGCGNRNSLHGLLPPLLLLELAGIQIINELKVNISGENPFPWPVIVRYKGLEVRREGKNTTIQFPDGSQEHHFGSSGKLFTKTQDT